MSTPDPRPEADPVTPPGVRAGTGTGALASVDPEELREGLLAALAVPRFAAEVSAHAPFASLVDLLSAAATAADPLSPAEISEALAHHPRIGEKPVGTGVSAEFSRREQSSADAEDDLLAARLAEGNRAYEQRFDRVFLIRAAGRTRAEILAELDRRRRLDDADDLRIVGEQLSEIALLRLTALFGARDGIESGPTGSGPTDAGTPGIGGPR